LINEIEDSRLAPLGNQAISRAWSTVLKCFENKDYLSALEAMQVLAYSSPDHKIGDVYDKWLKGLQAETIFTLERIQNLTLPQDKLPYQRELNNKYKTESLRIYKQLIQKMKPYLDFGKLQPQIKHKKAAHF
jgi:hypothetical protein